MKFIPSLVLVVASIVSLSASALTPADRDGNAVTAAVGARVIKIDSSTRYINVNHGDVIAFTNGDKTVNWAFDGIAQAVPLATIFPNSGAADGVLVYITPESQS